MTAQPTPIARDYLAEMGALVEVWCPLDGDWIATIVSGQMFTWLMANDPDLFHGWCEAQGITILAQRITARSRSQRMSAFHQRGPRAFAKASRAFDAGDVNALDPFKAHYVVDQANTRRSLGDMNKENLHFAASTYENRGNSALFEAAFLTALAKKVGNRTVGEVYTREQIIAMRN